MSLPVFINYLSEDDLTLERLTTCWDRCNMKNKSPHIDKLMAALHKRIKDKGDIPMEQVRSLCDKYRDLQIKKSIPPSIPYLEKDSVDGKEIQINPQTSIVFEKREELLVAIGVKIMDKVYPLQLKHMSICVTNGWYFHTESDIDCVFRV